MGILVGIIRSCQLALCFGVIVSMAVSMHGPTKIHVIALNGVTACGGFLWSLAILLQFCCHHYNTSKPIVELIFATALCILFLDGAILAALFGVGSSMMAVEVLAIILTCTLLGDVLRAITLAWDGLDQSYLISIRGISHLISMIADIASAIYASVLITSSQDLDSGFSYFKIETVVFEAAGITFLVLRSITFLIYIKNDGYSEEVASTVWDSVLAILSIGLYSTVAGGFLLGYHQNFETVAPASICVLVSLLSIVELLSIVIPRLKFTPQRPTQPQSQPRPQPQPLPRSPPSQPRSQPRSQPPQPPSQPSQPRSQPPQPRSQPSQPQLLPWSQPSQQPHNTSDRICIICLSAERAITLLPCGHCVLCEKCGSNNHLGNTCPSCQQLIVQRLRK